MSDMNEMALKQPPFADFLGLKVTHVSPERVTAELAARPELNNRFGIMHGGAVMALADNLGGTATSATRRYGLCRMHAAASRPHHHGLANPHYARRWQALRAGDANADGVGAREEIIRFRW
jgi:acyl-coenzyme A thioesterase PaaI-like protein